jgi:hypothetical protein
MILQPPKAYQYYVEILFCPMGLAEKLIAGANSTKFHLSWIMNCLVRGEFDTNIYFLLWTYPPKTINF